MTFDPFQLVPTQVEITRPVEAAPTYKEEVPLISPTIPPVSKTNPSDLFSNLYSQAKAKEIQNGPLYTYTTKEERRYSNPYLQFTPDVLGAYDMEDMYSKFQGSGEKFMNALVKTGATAGQSFISSFTGFGNQIDSIRSGKLFDEDSVLGQTSEWLEALEDKYPNYYSQWEREHPYMSAIPFMGGAANFWGDKVIKNAGFTIGSLASGVLVDMGINLATGGAATPASFILFAKQLNKAIAPLKNAFRNLAKASVVRGVDDFVGLGRVAGNMNKGLQAAADGYNLKKALQFAATTYFSAQGEAMIEGYQNYYNTKADLIRRADEKGTLNQELENIEKTAQEAGRVTTMLNIPIIAASNLLQFSNILAGKHILKQFDSPFLKIINQEGLTIVNNYSKKKAWGNLAKELGKDFVTEGFEEGYQYHIGASVHDYYLDQFNSEAKRGLGEFIFSQIPKTMEDSQFWENYFVGGLTGGLMGIYHPIKKNFFGKENQVVERLKPVFENFNKAVKQLTNLAENVEFSMDEKKLEEFYSAHKSLYSTVHDSLKFGQYDNFKAALKDLKDLPVEEYNKLFGTEFENQVQKVNAIDAILAESEQIQKEVTNTHKYFTVNPFDNSYTRDRIKDIFKVDNIQAKKIEAQLFDQFKELTAYNISRLRNINSWTVNAEQEMRMRGLDESILPVLKILGTEKAKNEYKRLKSLQLDALKIELDYQQQLDNEPEIITLKQQIKKLEKLLPKLDETTEEDELFSLIISQEMTLSQFEKEQTIKKQLEELKANEQVKQNIEKEIETQVNKPEDFAQEMVETVAELTPTQTLPVKTISKKIVIPFEVADRFRVETSEGTKTYILTNKRGEVTEAVDDEGNFYEFRPDGTIIKTTSNGTETHQIKGIPRKAKQKATPEEVNAFVQDVEQANAPTTPEEEQFYEQNQPEVDEQLAPPEPEKKDKKKSKKKLTQEKAEELFEKVQEEKEQPVEVPEISEPEPEVSGFVPESDEKIEEKESPKQSLRDRLRSKVAELPESTESTEEVPEESSEATTPTTEQKPVSLRERLKQKVVTMEETSETVNHLDEFMPEPSLLKEVLGWKLNKGVTIKC